MSDKNNKEWKSDSLYVCGLALLAACLFAGVLIKITGIRLNQILLPCLFNTLTGIYCPGCGGTRALAAMLQGNLADSLHYHPVVIYGAALYVWYIVSNTIQYISHGKCKIGLKYRRLYVWIGVAIVLFHTVWKNVMLLLYKQSL